MILGNADDALKRPVSSLCNLLWEFRLSVNCVATSATEKPPLSRPCLGLLWNQPELKQKREEECSASFSL